MTSSTPWHVEAHVWEAYAAGRLTPAAEASIETHVTGCPRCRHTAAAVESTSAATEEIWDRVQVAISTPVLPRPVRWARRLGARDTDLVVASAAESLTVPWAVAVGFTILATCAVGLADLGEASRAAVFLALAPLIPVLAVVAAYDAFDPLREIAEPTPYSKLRVALVRSSAALLVALPAPFAIGLLIPQVADLAMVWLLPALGLTTAALVLLTWFDAPVTGALVAAGWITTVAALRSGDRADVLTGATAQMAFGAALVVLATSLVLRTSSLRLQGGER